MISAVISGVICFLIGRMTALIVCLIIKNRMAKAKEIADLEAQLNALATIGDGDDPRKKANVNTVWM